MGFRCWWCDCDAFEGIDDAGEVIELKNGNEAFKDYSCVYCGHLVSEGNPRAGDPKETVESLKAERDELRKDLSQCEAERPKA